ncbi:MAG: chromosomal replication initiator protein DnaA [Pseudomonadota bacterium]|nr:chromosomal replication initiator protein DnaA [Pseudomonadota bacterium]
MKENTSWQKCLDALKNEVDEQSFLQWLRPLQAEERADELILYAPNDFVKQAVVEGFLVDIQKTLDRIAVGHYRLKITTGAPVDPNQAKVDVQSNADTVAASQEPVIDNSSYPMTPNYTIDQFVLGKSNELAFAAVRQVAQNPGGAYNPLFIIGDSGLGKTHLMQAAGHAIKKQNPNVLYVPSERFVTDMVKALQKNEMDAFKARYRQADALLIDDVQFFAKKGRTQEEFFHAFNALTESGKQVILTSDKYPQELEGFEERLRTRFSSGLTVSIDPPDLETRVAILKTKATFNHIELPEDVAFFIASNVQSNVRELEGALRKVMANAQFLEAEINLAFAKQALRDLLSIQQRLVSVENIQKAVANHFNIKVSDLKSNRRHRHVARPRQLAMYLAKEMSTKSLLEIGEQFGGRDHTTVIHAHRQVKKFLQENSDFCEDYQIIKRQLTQ